MIFIYIAIALVVLIFYVKWHQSYWQRKGIPTGKVEFFFGHIRKLVTRKSGLGELNLQLYRDLQKLDSKQAGIYFFLKPVYFPMDPVLIKHIMQNDFSHFMDHGSYHHPKDILSMHLFNLEGETWKRLRAKLTPTFSSVKMKMMFETLLEKTIGLEKAIGNFADNHEPFVIKEVLSRFTTDVIASCGFGIECDSLENPDDLFRKYGKKIFEPKPLRSWATGIVPWTILGYLGFKAVGYETTNFFTNIVKETIKTRETNEIFRKDFLHLLLQLKNQGTVSDSTQIKFESNTKRYGTLSEDDIIAQCFVFFLAGFETSSSTMTFTVLELAQNPDIQEKARQEINSVLEKYDGRVTYDAIMEMDYLEKVINESLRKFPPATGLPRICTKSYKVPGTNVVIDNGTRVQISVWGIHMDPRYYPNPEVFDPERFSEQNKASRPDFTFLPFGEGPRMCIGLRFGMLQSKVGLVTILRNFKFTLNKKTPLPIKMEENDSIISVKGDVWIDATRI